MLSHMELNTFGGIDFGGFGSWKTNSDKLKQMHKFSKYFIE